VGESSLQSTLLCSALDCHSILPSKIEESCLTAKLYFMPLTVPRSRPVLDTNHHLRKVLHNSISSDIGYRKWLRTHRLFDSIGLMSVHDGTLLHLELERTICANRYN
jgi:hypothetical protein